MIHRNLRLWRFYSLVVGLMLGGGRMFSADTSPRFELKSGDRVIFLGDTFAEREQYHGWIELMLTARFADRDVTFRNLGWTGDTPAGDSRFGLSLLQAGKEPADEGWNQLVKQIEDAKPTVVFVAYGMASSFGGEAGLAKFKSDYNRLLDTIAKASPGARCVLLSPIRHENLGSPWPDPAAHNAQLGLYSKAIGEIAAERQMLFVPPLAGPASGGPTLTDNGIHLTGGGYRAYAQFLEEKLFGTAGPWRASAQTEPLRQAILRKNEWFFHRSRPQNMAYIFGFRKREQGNNAGEITKFDEFIAAEEKRIAQLRALKPANVPEIPRHIGSTTAKHVEQPLPKLQIPDELEVTLWAEDPLLHKPIHMNFDARGRLWVASSELYPQIEPGQAATDKIIVLEDTKGGGRADKATVFADGLLIPTGVEIGDGGCYVAQSTELLHFKDTDGDGKADVRRTVLSGFGTEDTHHNLHTLRWGPDGRLYMDQSVYTRTDTETPHGTVRLKAGGIFRFDPRDERMEILYRGWVNAWGHQFDDFGQSFVTDGAGFQGVSWAIPGATYFTLAPARRMLQSISPGNYPKFCGIEIIRSDLFPADWQGDIITCDFRAHRVVRFKLSDQGAGYVTKEMPDLMRTTADSFRPLDAKLGPDGALYLADWSNPIIQHGEVDFRDPRRDKEHGRIWRIAYKGRAPLTKTDLTKLSTPALLDKLVSKNGYEQEKARRVLIERGANDVVRDLKAWLARRTNDTARLQAMWLYEAFNQTQFDLLNTLFSSSDARVRAAAVRALPTTDPAALSVLEKRIADENPRVRVEAVRALGKIRTARAAELALTVLDRPMDPFLDYALWLTVNELAEPWLAAVKSGTWKIAGREQQLDFGLKAVEPVLASGVLAELVAQNGIARDGSGPWIELIGSAGGPKELQRLFDALVRGEFDAAVTARAVAALNDAARLRSVKPDGALERVATLFSGSAAQRHAAVQLSGVWKLSSAVPQLSEIAGATDTPAAERAEAFAALRDIGGPRVASALKALLPKNPTPAVRREAVVTLAGLDFAAALPEIGATLKTTTAEADAQAFWRALLGIRGAAGKLANALPKLDLPKEIARAGLRPAREGNQNQSLVSALLKAAGLMVSNVQLSPAEMQKIAQEALAKGDAARGEQFYRRAELACMACHAIGGAGGKVGPDLTSIGASAQPDYLVESVLYPSAKIKEGYHSVAIATKDNQEFSGMIVKETENEIILRDAANVEKSIATKNIARRTNVGSLMPAGLIDTLLPEERLDLFKFLSSLGKPGDFDASKGGVARAWKLYLVVSQNEHLGVERVVAGDFTLKDWHGAYSLVSGRLAKDIVSEAIPNRNNNRGLFAATRFQSPKGGPARFTLSGATKGAWLNGAPVRAGTEFTADTKPGLNTIVIQLDDTKLESAAKLGSGDVTFVLE